MSDLHLNLKGEYFDAIKSGEKLYEYREVTPYWEKRLEGKEFDNVILRRGYPKASDTERTIIRPWKGFIKQPLSHKHFGAKLVNVYAIIVN